MRKYLPLLLLLCAFLQILQITATGASHFTPAQRKFLVMKEPELKEFVDMAKSSYSAFEELQAHASFRSTDTVLSTADVKSCTATTPIAEGAFCNVVLPMPEFQNLSSVAMVQAFAASAIPDSEMGAQVTVSFDSLDMTLLLTKDTLANIRNTEYSLQHVSGMQAEVTFPETFKPVMLSHLIEATTSGDIMSIYNLPPLDDDHVIALAMVISHGNSSAPLHVAPIESVPQFSMSLLANSSNGFEPVFARNMKFPPKPFVSVLLTTAEITDNADISDRIAHAYGSPECFRLDMESGKYSRDGIMKPKENAEFSLQEGNAQRYTIRCDSDRLELADHTRLTVLYIKPISWATLIYSCCVVGIGAAVLAIMVATDANSICAGRPKSFQPVDFRQRSSVFSELTRNHMWLSLPFGIADNFKSTKYRDPTTGKVVVLPPEWNVRKYQNLFIWASSLMSYSVGAMALVSALRTSTYFPLETNPTKYLILDYWLACVACAIACGKGVHIILSIAFSRIQYTFAAIQIKESEEEKRASSVMKAFESVALGRPLPLPVNIIMMVLCILFIAGMCFVTIFLGLDYDWQSTYLWTIGTIAAVVLDMIVLDPAYIGLRAFVLSFFQAVQKPATQTTPSDDDDVVVEEEGHHRVKPEDEEENSEEHLVPSDEEPKKPEKKHPRDSWAVWFLTLLTWEYMTLTVMRGLRRPLEDADLQGISYYDKSNTLTHRFMAIWEPMRQHIKGGAVLIRAIFATFGSRFLLAVALRFAADALVLVSPTIMQELIKYLVDLGRDPLPGYLLIVAMFLCNYVAATIQSQAFDIATRLGMNIRATLSSAIYRKSLVLSNKARQSRSTGQIVNLMSIDSEKFQMVMPLLPWLFTSIMQVAVGLVFLFVYLGYAAFVAVGVMLALVPLNILIMGVFQTIRKKILINTDKRVKSVNELLQSIRIVKFFAWEDSFAAQISLIRRFELILFVGIAVCKAVLGVILAGAPIVISVGTFGLFAGIYGQDKLTPDVVFPAMAYLNILRMALTLMPMLLAMSIDLSVSLGRIGSFLSEEEMQKDAVAAILDDADSQQNAIVINDGCFEWEVPDDDQKKPNKMQQWKQKRAQKKERKMTSKSQQSLNMDVEIEMEEALKPTASSLSTVSKDVGKLIDIDLKIRKGSLTAIVGTVGSGKSSLLGSLIGDMKKTQGSVGVAGSIAYCAQSAWIVNDTVRGNITFGKRYDEDKYQHIVKVCALETDLKILAGGDQTEIGEKGVNLSGGQRQRISLARAVYSDADIYLLDDPLSAVDAHVGKYLFDECISGHLKSKTRVLVTHQIQHIHKADHIVVMDQGRIVEQGPFDALMEYGPDGHLVKMMAELQEHKTDEEENAATIVELDGEHADAVTEQETVLEDETIDAKARAEAEAAQGALMTLEERTTGRLTVKNVMFYVNACGGPIIVSLVMILYGIAQTGMLMTDWWLTQWTSNNYSYLSLGEYFGIYIGVGALTLVLVFFRDSIFAMIGVLGSKKLHESMLHRIIRAPSSFFDTTPIGRILNRFSKDMESVDQLLGQMLTQFFNISLQTIGNCVLMIIAMYWLSIPLVIFTIIYLIIQQIYTTTFRELKRIEAITRSPVYSHFSESLTGISSIRAYSRQQDFIDKFDDRLDINVAAFRTQNDVQRWLQFRLDIIGSMCTLAVGIMAMVLRNSESVDPSLMSLALTYSLSMTGMLSFMVRTATEAEAAFASVERISYYVSHVPTEPAAIIADNRPPQEWPHKGEIVFENVEARYRPELPLVIKGISLNVKSNEKVGVVGRTGSGKSTIMLLLFRMFDVSAGRIEIDGININDIGLQDLRSKIAIIPQEPTLFTGTVRSNLDPFNEYTDKYLWEALERAHLKEAIEKLEKGLDAPVSENGENFSVGQRQLICLARALCKQSKILILDEASASLDFATDTLIQKTVREAFADCTRLTIAHRLNTIIDSDRVLVLDQGQVAEFDSPRNLFENHPDGIFSSLVDETGQANAALLRSIALGEITFDSALEEMQKLQEQEQEQMVKQEESAAADKGEDEDL